MDPLNEFKNPSCESVGKWDEVHPTEAKKVLEPPQVSEGTASLGPTTPVAHRENGEFPYDCKSPLTVVKKLPKVPCFDSHNRRNEIPCAPVDHSSPQTPKDVVFDPFAPGPDDMVLAPLCKKYADEMRTTAARCLKFDSPVQVGKDGTNTDDVDSISDEEMFKSVYENLLEAIISMQTEELLADISNVDWDADSCKTPPLATRLSGIADTCPGAPMKAAGKSRNIDLALCRKLQF